MEDYPENTPVEQQPPEEEQKNKSEEYEVNEEKERIIKATMERAIQIARELEWPVSVSSHRSDESTAILAVKIFDEIYFSPEKLKYNP